MSGFKLRISSVGSDRSTNRAKTTAHITHPSLFVQHKTSVAIKVAKCKRVCLFGSSTPTTKYHSSKTLLNRRWLLNSITLCWS